MIGSHFRFLKRMGTAEARAPAPAMLATPATVLRALPSPMSPAA
jgi:hypothetical protein